MCGIYFHHRIDSVLSINEELTSFQHLASRGPDQQIIEYPDHFTSLGFTRLSIRSLKDGGQPYRINETLISCINGELYNEDEIRLELTKSGLANESPPGDMQLMGFYLSVYGIEKISNVRGMFAGFIYNSAKNKIIIFRDRLGEKPLFLSFSENEITISSDARCILERLEFNTTLNPSGLRSGIWKSPETPFLNVYQLPPGNWASIDISKNFLQPIFKSYWTWPSRSIKKHSSQERKFLLAKLKTQIDSSVKETLVSDVPTCLFLSGGLDSTLVLKTIYDYRGPGFPCFTLAFSDGSHSESENASKIANSFKSNHTNILISPTELVEDFYKMLDSMDIPILDPSCLALYALSSRTSSNYKVAISGDGGDELFQGYKLFEFLPLIKLISSTKYVSKRFVYLFLKLLGESNQESYLSTKMLLERLMVSLNISKSEFFEIATSQFGGNWQILNDCFSNDAKYFNTDKVMKKNSKLEAAMLEKHYQSVVLPDLYLQKSDRMTMANSQELRAPLLGKKVIDSAMEFSSQDLKKMPRRDVMRYLLNKSVPESVLNAPKHGFSVPLTNVLREIDKIDWDLDSIGISPDVANKFLISAKKGNENNGRTTFALIVLNHFQSKLGKRN